MQGIDKNPIGGIGQSKRRYPMGKVMLITQADKKQLLANARNPDKSGNKPVIKIFNPYGGGTWLISEMDPEDEDRLFGLSDLGLGMPELGYMSHRELDTTLPLRVEGLYLERDRWFTASKTLAEYAD
jgi:hypothetical protein